MKQPTPSDFIVNVKESSVSVIFKPSNSDYNFVRLVSAVSTHETNWVG